MKGDFLGFSFDGIHCSELGITHVSGGDRYDENLFPEVRDKTVEIPGNHGEYYYGSTFGTRTFDLAFAYDHVTERQFRQIRRLFGTTKVCELIFDERPYKVYYAKPENPVEMNYICFDEEEWYWESEGHDGYIPGSINHKVYTGNRRRIYKGEGTISLVCHFPFARQLFKIKELYSYGKAIVGQGKAGEAKAGGGQGNLLTVYNNVDEWIESSGILTQQEFKTRNIDKVIPSTLSDTYTYTIPVYNPGDLNVGFCLYIPFDKNGKILTKEGKSAIIINGDEDVLFLKPITRKPPLNDIKPTDTGILINTTNHLIEGVNYSYVAQTFDYRRPAWQTTGNIYNEYILKGDFPHINRNDWIFDNEHHSQSINISCAEIEEADDRKISIYYNYLYF